MKKLLAVLMAGMLLTIFGSTVFAADSAVSDASVASTAQSFSRKGRGALTEEQKAQLEAKKAELLATYQALPDDEKSLFKEMMQVLSPGDLLTDAEKVALKAKQEAAKAEKEAELKAKYDSLTTEQKALVDEIKAAFQAKSAGMTDEEKASLKAKQEAVLVKIKALSEADRAAIADFLPRMGMGGGRGGRFGRGNGMTSRGGAPEPAPADASAAGTAA